MTVLKTQTSSKPRLQNDTLGNEALVELYKAYETMSIMEFRQYAESVVQAGGGRQSMKTEIINSMSSPLATKTTILTKAQNFILAGMGLGV